MSDRAALVELGEDEGAGHQRLAIRGYTTHIHCDTAATGVSGGFYFR